MDRVAIIRSLSAILSELLGREVSDVDRDFTDYGLTSILAIRVISRVRDLYDVELPIFALFQMETASIAGLSDYIATLKWLDTTADRPAAADSADLEL